MTWQEAVSEAISIFESKHSGGVEKVAKLIDEASDDIYEDELYSEASTAIADPAHYLKIELSDEENDALEDISNNNQERWVQQCKEAVDHSQYFDSWVKIIKFIAENGF